MYGWKPTLQAQAPDNPGVRLQHDMDAQFGENMVVVTNYAVSGAIKSHLDS